MKKKDDKNKQRRVVKITTAIVAIILTCAVCFTGLVFLSNVMFDIDLEDTWMGPVFDRISVSTIIEEIQEKEENWDYEFEYAPHIMNIAFYGDSISTFSGYVPTGYSTAYPNGDVQSVEQTWWYLTAQKCNMPIEPDGLSVSVSGSAVQSGKGIAPDGNDDSRISLLPMDAGHVVVFLGTNDIIDFWDQQNFHDQYVSMISKLQARCPDAHIYCCTLYQMDESIISENNKDIINGVIKDVAASQSCKLIDFDKSAGMIWSEDTIDGVHPNAKGMEKLAGLAAAVINNDVVVETTPPQPNMPGMPNQPPSTGGIGPIDTSGWYSDITSTAPQGSVVAQYDGVSVFNGLPWPNDGTVYLYNQWVAEKDIYDLYDSFNVTHTKVSGTNAVIDSAVSGSQPAYNVDGLLAISINESPAMMDRSYYPAKAILSNDADSGGVGTYKFAVVVVPKGASLTDSSKYLYIPATKPDRGGKGHVFYGGVVQTNVQLSSGGTDQVTLKCALNWSGSQTASTTISVNNGVPDLKALDNFLASVNGFGLKDWKGNHLETYNLDGNMDNMLGALRNNYDIVGFLVWGSSTEGHIK